MRISSDIIDRVRESTRIEDVISSYVSLKKKGNRYWGCCPFHHEKTPSFSVSPDRGMFYCFGCHVGGNVFTFLQKMENISFYEAVKQLAEVAHIELPSEEMTPEDREREAETAAMMEATALAADYFHSCLLKTNMGQEGLAYFRKRHLSDETIEAFHLGFAPPFWDRLFSDFTKKKNIAPKILVASGLCGERDGRYFDMFRNRCMFPILNLRGKPVAFGGRVMGDGNPKYLNSPETPIFNKRRLLFALFQALPEIRKKRQVIMVEGYMDAISLHAHGVTNVVASLGTAFTVEQARLLKRYADEVVFCYDMDAAGQNATRRALEIAGPVGLKLRVAQLGEGKDPDEFVNLHGADAYLECIAQAQPAMDYLFTSLQKEFDGTSLEGQQQILQAMFAVLVARGDSFLLDSFIRKMAQALRLDEGLVRSEAARFIKKKNAQMYVPKGRQEETGETAAKSKQSALEEGFLRYCLLCKKSPTAWDEMKDFSYADPFHARLSEALAEAAAEGTVDEASIEARLSPEEVEKLAQLLLKDTYIAAVPEEEYVRPLRLLQLQEEYKAHTEKANALSASDPQAAKEEMLACIRLSREIRALGGR